MGAPEAPAADPKHYTVDIEDERVRVLRIHYGPHEKSVMHSHPAHVAVLLSDFHIRFAFPDGTSQEVNGEAGQVLSVPGGDHLPENLSDQPLDAILVELKGV